MYDGKGFCPMGVLCEIELTSEWEFNDRYLPSGQEEWSISHSIHRGVLVPPKSFLSAIGLSFLDVAHITRVGDKHGATFTQCAAWIEEHL